MIDIIYTTTFSIALALMLIGQHQFGLLILILLCISLFFRLAMERQMIKKLHIKFINIDWNDNKDDW